MKNRVPVFLLFASALAGCSSGSAENTVDTLASPITAPINALVNKNLPLPQDREYIYRKRIPGTNIFESHVSDHPLTNEEMSRLGIDPKDNTRKAE